MSQALIYIHQVATHTAIHSSHHGHGHGSDDIRFGIAIYSFIACLCIPGLIMYFIGVKKKGWIIFEHSLFVIVSICVFAIMLLLCIIIFGSFLFYQLICMNS